MTLANVGWAGLLAAGLAFEIYTLCNGMPGDTLSERIRAWFAVHTRGGQGVFLTAWAGFAVWFAFHIVRCPR